MKVTTKSNRIMIYITITVFVFNLIAVFVVFTPVFASENNIDFSNQPLAPSENILVWNGTDKGYVHNNSSEYVYVFAYWRNFAILTKASADISSNLTIEYTNGITYGFTKYSESFVSANETWYLYTTQILFGSALTDPITVPTYYQSSPEAPEWLINQVVTDINNTGGAIPPPPPNSYDLNYSLPPGNLAIITTNASYTSIKLTTTMPLQSTIFSSNPWPNTTQRIGTYNTLPQSLNPTTLGNVIEWAKTGDKTLFGNTHSAIYEPNIVSTFTYVVVSNPFYYPANNMEDNQYTNGSINILMDDVVSIEVVNLTATVNTSTGEIENNPNGTSWTGEIDEDTGDITWTDNNGENTAPDGGGNLSDPTITGFQSWLKGILTSIKDIFEPAHDAIQTLSGAIRNFASWMYALYVWLPSPILNLLTSAISLAIVIGVIKVFI